MEQRKMIVLALALVSAAAWSQQAARWTMRETTEGKDPKTVSYQRTSNGAHEPVLICEKARRTQTTFLDSTGSTLRWMRQDDSGTSMELTRVGREFVSRSEGNTVTFPGGDLPWFQDLNQLGPFVLGRHKEIRFVAFADFLDARLKASDLTVFKATRLKTEHQVWASGAGSCWKVRVTFDDFRSAFWGAHYWYRVSDGQLVRYEEVRGGPGTPVTVGVLASEGTP